MQDNDTDNKLLTTYHITSLKFLINMFCTESGKELVIADDAKGSSLIFFVMKSLKSENLDILFLAS